MKEQTDRDGYKTICLWFTPDKGSFLRINRLVALYFVKNDDPVNKNIVNHIDTNRANNNYKNLEWCTQKENIAHSYKMGTMGGGEKAGNHKLTKEEVEKICELLENPSIPYNAIANKIGSHCTVGMIKNIAYCKSWTDVSSNYDFSERLSIKNIRNKNKLKEKDVHKICKLIEKKIYTVKEIADMLGITYAQVANIRYKMTWKYISKKYNF